MTGCFVPGLETCEDRRLLSGLGGLLSAPLTPVVGLVKTIETAAPVGTVTKVVDTGRDTTATVGDVAKVVDQALAPLVGEGLSSIASLVEGTGSLLNSLAPPLSGLETGVSSVVSTPNLPSIATALSEVSHGLDDVAHVSLHTASPEPKTDAAHLVKEVRTEPTSTTHERTTTKAKSAESKERKQEDETAEEKPISESELRSVQKNRHIIWFEEPSSVREEADVSKIEGEEGKETEGDAGARDRIEEVSPINLSRDAEPSDGDAVGGAATESLAVVEAATERVALSALDPDAIFSGADGLMSSFVPFDPSQLEEGVARLLDQLGRLRGEVGDWLSNATALAPWLTAAAAGLAAAEMMRRRREANATEADYPYLASTVPLP
jgi:hypothetical protein